LRIALVTPFLDRRHGTERVILEQLERFAAKPGVELHIYAQRIDDLSGVSRYQGASKATPPNSLIWHKVPALPGPHLFGYLWWFFANQFCRWIDDKVRGLKCDLVYSPGINAWDADAIAIHIVFHEFYRQVRTRLSLRGSPPLGWPRRLHRRLYYLLIMALERRIYTAPRTNLAAVSQLVSRHLTKFFGRSDAWVIPNAVDVVHFTPEARSARRASARERFGLTPETFALLLIGNDWEKKGLATLLHSMAECHDLPLKLVVAGRDDPALFAPLLNKLQLHPRVQFEPSSSDVIQFYAAADLYVSPSLEDSFALPPIEAMACGLPVITSVNNGGSQIITNSVDGFVLEDPCDAQAVAALIRNLFAHPDVSRRVGESAARTARGYSWDRNAEETWRFLMATLDHKRRRR
jgi:glycosyltransferase involved in cell wall biosynthesis